MELNFSFIVRAEFPGVGVLVRMGQVGFGPCQGWGCWIVQTMAQLTSVSLPGMKFSKVLFQCVKIQTFLII